MKSHKAALNAFAGFELVSMRSSCEDGFSKPFRVCVTLYPNVLRRAIRRIRFLKATPLNKTSGASPALLVFTFSSLSKWKSLSAILLHSASK